MRLKVCLVEDETVDETVRVEGHYYSLYPSRVRIVMYVGKVGTGTPCGYHYYCYYYHYPYIYAFFIGLEFL